MNEDYDMISSCQLGFSSTSMIEQLNPKTLERRFFRLRDKSPEFRGKRYGSS